MDVDPSARTEAGAVGNAPAELGPGAEVGKYRLDRVLGAGGMGVVWAAYDPDLERRVAIKLLRSIDNIVALRTRLLREARAMARLKHSNVLTVYEVGTDRNRDYIVMELIDGADLDRWLAGKPPRAEIFAALVAAGRGLAAAHDAGLIHRDLKPHNILRGRDGCVYVTDFGLARGQIEDGADIVQTPLAMAATAVASGSQPRAIDSVLDSPLTQTGVLIGTPAYMAPEQFAGRVPDPRSDQFAYCVTAWEALTGSRPFAGRTLDELRAAALAGAGGDARLPPRVRSVLARGLSPDPAGRWPNMRALLAELEAAIAPPRRSRAPLVAAAAVGIAAVVTGVAVYAQRDDAATQDSATPSGECQPAAQAFGAAWSNERRKAVTARHRRETMLIAATAMLDETRRDWIKIYEATCAMPAAEERQDRLACLFEARDDLDETTRELASEADAISITSVVPLTIAVGACKR